MNVENRSRFCWRVSSRPAVVDLVVLTLAMTALSGCDTPVFSIRDTTESRGSPIFTLSNPFRDRLPEEVAEHFFCALRRGDVVQASRMIRGGGSAYFEEAERAHRIRRWRLDTRKDIENLVEMTFVVARCDDCRPEWSVTLGVEKNNGVWEIVSYDAYY